TLDAIGSLRAALQAARDAQEKFKERLDKVRAAVEACEICDPEGSFTVDGLPQTLDDAQDAYNDASNRVKEIEIQLAQAERGNTQAIEDAQQDLEQAVRDLEVAQRGPKPLDVEMAQANVAVAEAALVSAETRLARLQDGPDPDQLAAGQARLTAAQASLAAAREALEQANLRAPYAGTVTAVMIQSGEATAAGLPVLELIDTQRWRIETKDVGELMIGRVRVEQPVIVTVNAFPGEELPGAVVAIAPTAIVQLGDTTYAVTIELEPTALDLRWGMTAKVNIRTDS
ncbi:MAG TPA: HlyD family efflux transporter periplasmic adaptor subunit, partial [Anaerolineales bacterium]|nr:HlyD family efflux transporter periplasmic adaptor subunit [Anaerolineales bacterium]